METLLLATGILCYSSLIPLGAISSLFLYLHGPLRVLLLHQLLHSIPPHDLSVSVMTVQSDGHFSPSLSWLNCASCSSGGYSASALKNS